MLRFTVVPLILLTGSAILHFAQEPRREAGTLVGIEFEVPAGKTPYPREFAAWGKDAYCVVQLSSHIHDNALFHIPQSGAARAVTLADGSAVAGQVLSLVQGAPYVFRRQGEVRGYLSLADDVATPVVFPDDVKLGRFNQSFCAGAPDLFWDADKRELYRIQAGKAAKIVQDMLNDVSELNACQIAEGHLIVEMLSGSSGKPRAWILDTEGKLTLLSIPCEAPIAFSGLVSTTATQVVYAGASDDVTLFVFQDRKLSPLTDNVQAMISRVRPSSIMAVGHTLYFCRSDDAGSETLWARSDDGLLAKVSGIGGTGPGTLYFPPQSDSGDTAVVNSSDGSTWLIRERKAVRVVDADGSPLTRCDQVAVMDASAWLLSTAESVHTLYYVNSGGRASVAELPDGTLARADTSMKRTPRGASVAEGISLGGGGSHIFCRRWDAIGSRLYRLRD